MSTEAIVEGTTDKTRRVDSSFLVLLITTVYYTDRNGSSICSSSFTSSEKKATVESKCYQKENLRI